MITFALAGCRPDPGLPRYGDWPVWIDEHAAVAEDLGHAPSFSEPPSSGPLVFVDGAEAAGLGAAVGGGNQHGVGIGLVDLDGDGWLDLVLANGRSNVTGAVTPSALYWNAGDGTFVDGTAALGGALDGRDLYSVAAGDLDNDGRVDLVFGAQPADVLLTNLGARRFADRSSALVGPRSDPAAVADGRSKIVSIGDLDADGWQDVVSASSTLPDPGVTVAHNLGGGAFEDWTAHTGAVIAGDGNPCAVMFTDYDNDGRRDLWIWNDRGGHVLLHNTGGGVLENFENTADRVSIRNPMGIDGADIDLDGDLDYYVSNIGGHPLLENQGDGTFVDVTSRWDADGDFGWGLAFEDFDLDGLPDLYVTQEDDRPVLVYHNVGGAFDRSAIPTGGTVHASAAHNVPAATGDIDRDGRVDAVWVRTDGSPLVLHHNQTDVTGRHWLEVEVADTPGTGERGGIGARVVVRTPDGRTQFRDITAGSSRASQSALSVRFGLGGWDGAELVFVAWPDGRALRLENVPGDRTLSL
ncbi:MAG: CRTAC1 family protein [Myxococcota bacterium]